ncbi:thiamine pyrophosphate-binding protein [Mycolicibacterium hodleri]|uniref:acetolactate synthase n=1 Tax=Mycolicibacterium hodleri TaxID=49897 RepID=A0A502EBA8_9MYCO|nr:thiamine pyrophosphate-binding protein [Mycolicibacterium hodleri]TPG35015.1 thiamine pyrophosphate-binding protein [Mycolicibacterium hodleri]
MALTGGQLLALALAEARTTEVFTLHGGHLDSFLSACAERGIRLTDTRHEGTAGFAADAYARMTGRPGICVVTSGPGFTNVYSAIVNAYLDAIPVLFIIGAPPLREQETNPLQGGFDQIGAAAPVTKWAHRVTSPERIPELVALALRHALSGKPGPVLLEIPIDVMVRPTDATVRIPEFPNDIPRPAASASSIGAAMDLLASAERPIIVTGGGAMLSRCSAELRRFAELAGVPVFTPNKGDGLLPASHRLWAGGAGPLASLPVSAQPPDVVFLLGCRAGMFTGGRNGVLSKASIIQVDVDYGEMGRLDDVAVPVVADCRAALQALIGAVEGRTLPNFSDWAERVVAGRRSHQKLFSDNATASGRLHPYFAAREIMAALPPRTIAVLDGGEAPAWAGFFLNAEEPNSVLRLGYLGCLGVGQGFSIGAARAEPDRPVLLLTGDGSAAFHLAEFDTMVRHGLPIVTVVFNNAVWGMSIHGQQAVYGADTSIVSTLQDSSYEQVCAAFGGYADRVEKLDDIAPAIERAFTAAKPVCINVAVDPNIVHPLTTSMLGDLTATDEIVVPYYENIPL